jgi:hypothetical protein
MALAASRTRLEHDMFLRARERPGLAAQAIRNSLTCKTARGPRPLETGLARPKPVRREPDRGGFPPGAC